MQPGNLYDSAFIEWTQRTAELTRKRRFSELDVEHVADQAGVKLAADESGLKRDRFPVRCPFTVGEILDEEFLPS